MTEGPVRRCYAKEDFAAILSIMNAAAEAYRGAIPADQWHDPYMSAAALPQDIDAGVAFWGCAREGQLAGVMGLQPVRDVGLIRHAYVLPSEQRRGIGGMLLRRLRAMGARQMLVGTWRAADWAIRFYERHGFALVPATKTAALLSAYWTVSSRQAQASVVLAHPPL